MNLNAIVNNALYIQNTIITGRDGCGRPINGRSNAARPNAARPTAPASGNSAVSNARNLMQASLSVFGGATAGATMAGGVGNIVGHGAAVGSSLQRRRNLGM